MKQNITRTTFPHRATRESVLLASKMVIVFLDLMLTSLHLLIIIIILPFLLLFYVPYMAITLSLKKAGGKDQEFPPNSTSLSDFELANSVYISTYKTMSDGVLIAIDIWLPNKSGEPFPVMINAARYYRSSRLWWPFSSLRAFGGKPFSMLEFLSVKGYLAEGMAVVLYDVRGSGASFGTNNYPWWPRERDDSVEIIDWVMKQSFCNKKIGLWGTSYSANAALHSSFQYANKLSNSSSENLSPHTGITTCISLYGFWDVYS